MVYQPVVGGVTGGVSVVGGVGVGVPGVVRESVGESSGAGGKSEERGREGRRNLVREFFFFSSFFLLISSLFLFC